MTDLKWQFSAHFRRHAFGWKSDLPIQRIKEALSEIKLVAKKEPVLAAQGAVTLLEKLSPALAHVDSSSGAIGSAVNRAIGAMVLIISKSEVDRPVRQKWLERLWKAFQADEVPYIEMLGDSWGELCVTTELASQWADEFLPSVEHAWSQTAPGQRFFKGTTACFASLYAAERHEELLLLLDKAPFKWWHDRRWGVKALVAMGRKSEAIQYAQAARGRNDPSWQIAQACEAILLSSGMFEEAYVNYALEANQSTTNLATFRAITKKYPNKSARDILRDLIASQPSAQGKWFAAAKDAGLFDMAIELTLHSPTDPRTLARAARDYGKDQPDFAIASGLAALRWISLGYGYEITSGDVLDAYTSLIQAAHGAGINDGQIVEQIRKMTEGSQSGNQFLKTSLARQLAL